MVDFLKPKSILDYGCGKGNLVRSLAEKYPDIKVYGYDPAVEDFSSLPVDKADFVVNTDVLEHIPEDELPETVARIASISQNVFFHLHHGKAAAVLENGENAHCTIYTRDQYYALFRNYFPAVEFLPGLNWINSCCFTFKIPAQVAEQCKKFLFGNDKIYLENTQELVQNLHRWREIILLPIGNEGSVTLECLKYSNLMEKITCVANIQPEPLSFINERPILFLTYLPHFRETALMLIAAPDNLHDVLFAELKRLGFQNIAVISRNLAAQLQDELNRIANSGQMMQWFMNSIQKKIDTLEYRIAEQDEICALHTKIFSAYQNCFRGKKIVIVGTGSTVKYYQPIPDAIHIGLNYAWQRENIPFDYLFAQDNSKSKSSSVKINDGFSKIRHKIFIGKLSFSCKFNFINFPEIVSNSNVLRYCVTNPDFTQPIFQDIRYHPLIEFGSVVFSALHFALFTYPAEIYLVGCDTSTNGYFYSDAQIANNLDINQVKLGYARVKIFADQYYPETKIISINPVGLKGLFLDVYTEEFLGR